MENELIRLTVLHETRLSMMRDIENERLLRINEASSKSLLEELARKLRSMRGYNQAWANSQEVKTLMESIDADQSF